MARSGQYPPSPHALPARIPFSCSISAGHPSISVLQWLLNAETSHPTSSPPHRLTRFFTTLHAALKNPSRAVFQFYPTSDDQVQLITSIAQKAGFGGGVVVDFPNSKKARKVFLCLYVGGGGGQQQVPKGLEGEEVDEEDDGRALFEKRRERLRSREKGGKRKGIKDKDWILKKKEVRVARPWFAAPLLRGCRATALPQTRKRGRTTRLTIYRAQAESCILASRMPSTHIASCCALARCTTLSYSKGGIIDCIGTFRSLYLRRPLDEQRPDLAHGVARRAPNE